MADAKDYVEQHSHRSDGPTKCTWFPGTKEPSPHMHYRSTRPKILPTILDAIGETPMVRLNRVTTGLACEVVAKCEFFNAGGSVKDRIGRRMVEDAERSGRIKPGDTLIEPTSGNTGIGLALAAAIRGYRMIITLPEKMSQEKVDVLKGLGAQIIRTPTEASFDSPESHIGVAKRLNKEIPRSHILDQYSNPSNPLAHYDGTAEEIWEQCEGHIDMIVLTAGTGGTLTGIARKLKERNPKIIVVAVDPRGSILAEPDTLNEEKRLQSYVVEGIGYDFIPTVLDRSLVDVWVKTDDAESLIMARRLIREEGLLCGGSSGSAVCGVLRAATSLKAGQRCVVLLPDSVRNYMSKFLSDDYMWRNSFVDLSRGIGVGEMPTAVGPADNEDDWWGSRTVAELGLEKPVTVTPDLTCERAVELLARTGFDQLPVVGDNNVVLGVLCEGQLTSKLVSRRVRPTDSITKAAFSKFSSVTMRTPLRDLARMFDRDHFVVVIQSQTTYTGGAEVREVSFPVGVVSRIDLLRYIMQRRPSGGVGNGEPTGKETEGHGVSTSSPVVAQGPLASPTQSPPAGLSGFAAMRQTVTQ